MLVNGIQQQQQHTSSATYDVFPLEDDHCCGLGVLLTKLRVGKGTTFCQRLKVQSLELQDTMEAHKKLAAESQLLKRLSLARDINWIQSHCLELATVQHKMKQVFGVKGHD